MAARPRSCGPGTRRARATRGAPSAPRFGSPAPDGHAALYRSSARRGTRRVAAAASAWRCPTTRDEPDPGRHDQRSALTPRHVSLEGCPPVRVVRADRNLAIAAQDQMNTSTWILELLSPCQSESAPLCALPCLAVPGSD